MTSENLCARNEGHGIHVCRDACGAFISNQVHSNRKDGITIRSGANPLVGNNIIYGNGSQHINICDGGKGSIEENEVA